MPQVISHFKKVSAIVLLGKNILLFSVHSTGLGFGAALGFMAAFIVTITIVLAGASARARMLKGIQIFMDMINYSAFIHHSHTDLSLLYLGKKRKMFLRKNAAYEVHAFTSRTCSHYIQPPNTPHGTGPPEAMHIPNEKNPVYEEVQ